MNITEYIEEIRQTNYNIDKKITNYITSELNIFPQLGECGSFDKSTKQNLEFQSRVVIKWLDKHVIKRKIESNKTIKIWQIAAVMLDNYFLIGLIIKPNIKENSYPNFIPINKEIHNHAGYYLFEFIKIDYVLDLKRFGVRETSEIIKPEYQSINLSYFELDNLDHIKNLNNILEHLEKYN